MMRLIVALTLCGFVVSAAERDTSVISGQFVDPLRDALMSRSISIDDLRFRTDYTKPDSFRLAKVDSAFTDALGGLDRAYAMGTDLADASTPGGVLAVLAGWLDITAVIPDTRPGPRSVEDWRVTVETAGARVRAAFATLSSDDLDSLWDWSLEQLREEEESNEDGVIDIYTMRAQEHYERERARRHLALAKKVDLAKLIRAANGLASMIALPDSKSVPQPGVYSSSVGPIRIGTLGDDEYTGDFSLIIDPGGNDRYNIETGERPLGNTVRVIIDGSGDDTYRGSIGSGLFGVGFVFDGGGDDVYDGTALTQGCAAFGVGMVWDVAGDDIYRARSVAQGIGEFGIGALIDLSGGDVYKVGTYGQGLGSTSGIGVLDDRGGNDSYLSGGAQTDVLRYDDHYVTMTQGVGLGNRPVASGGIGMLCDRLGNDTYVADIFGQGVAYWLGIGALIDEHGHDRYTAYQYAQGAGVHLAAGYLIDRWGHDLYSSNGVSQGSGHDLAVGVLFDETGDDSYVTEGLSLGAGNANGISLLVDMTGDDGYIARRSDVLGYSDQRRDYGMVGVALDLGGRDRYAAPWGADSTWWHHSTYGVGVNTEWSTTTSPPREPDRGRGKSAEEIQSELKDDPDSLFVQASNPVAAFRYLVKPAEERLAQRNAELWPLWAKMLSSESARERHSLLRIHQNMFRNGDTTNVALLVDSLHSEVDRARLMAARLLGFTYLGSDTAEAHIQPLIEMLGHDDWRTRQTAALSLRLESDTRAESALIEALDDSVMDVRRAAALALDRAGTSDSDAALVGVLFDSSQIVRYSAERALTAHASAAPLLLPVITADTTFAAMHALRAIISDTSGRDGAAVALTAALQTERPWAIRAAAADVIAAWEMTEMIEVLESARAAADHPYLRQRINSALEVLRDRR
jgi:hypothetical protein